MLLSLSNTPSNNCSFTSAEVHQSHRSLLSGHFIYKKEKSRIVPCRMCVVSMLYARRKRISQVPFEIDVLLKGFFEEECVGVNFTSSHHYHIPGEMCRD